MHTAFNHPHVSLFILAWFLADQLTAIGIRLARRWQAMDKPHSYKTHALPTPFIGGASMYLAFALTIFSILNFEWDHIAGWYEIFSVVAAGGIVMLLGLVDDFRPINATFKLVFLIVVTWILYHYGARLTLFPQDWLWDTPNFALTLLWIAGVMSALNSLDNMDGASGGIAAIASVTLFAISWYTYQRWLSFVSISLLGASLGFLRYNFHLDGAKTFMGDNGSFFLGLALASMCALGDWSGYDLPGAVIAEDALKSLIVPCAVLGVPLYDITLATILRFLHGKVRTPREAIEFCGRDHIAHRLVAFGFSRRQAVYCLYALAIAFGLAAYLIVRLEMTRWQYLALSIAGIGILCQLGIWLNRAPVYAETDDAAGHEPRPAHSNPA